MALLPAQGIEAHALHLDAPEKQLGVEPELADLGLPSEATGLVRKDTDKATKLVHKVSARKGCGDGDVDGSTSGAEDRRYIAASRYLFCK